MMPQAGRDATTAAVDYLQRTLWRPFELASGSATVAADESRCLFRVSGIGCLRRPGPPTDNSPGGPMPTQSVLVGLSGYRIPLALLLDGRGAAIRVHLGVWAATNEHVTAATVASRLGILRSLLAAAYPVVDCADEPFEPVAWALGGLALGVPSPSVPAELDGGVALDRLARAMTGARWRALVLAQPVDEAAVAGLRHHVTNELRAVQTEADLTRTPSPLAARYAQLLSDQLAVLDGAQALGGWRVGVYLFGDADSYYRLASAWRATFTGERSVPETVRVFDGRAARDLGDRWALPDAPGPVGTGGFRHPFGCQTLLNSAQLAAYVHLPRLETPGFGVRIIPAFGAVPAASHSPEQISIGTVVHRTGDTATAYSVPLQGLSRHALVAGTTGAGKSNTIRHVLRQAAGHGIAFLVVEPAKAEYRAMLADPAIPDPLVFTLGDERVSPFRINPFEVIPGVRVSEHLDLLRAVFAASFGMWTPLPQVLQRCLHEIYQDRGWDLARNTNNRLRAADDPADAFPTLSDLVEKVREVVPRLGYEQRVGDDMLAALVTRVDGLRDGAKGRMLDNSRSLPMEALLSTPAVLELEALGDDDDKAFLMGLLFARIVEYRRVQGPVDRLRHLLVIEEAHRLLADGGAAHGPQEADPRGKAVETISNLLSEIRAYGQGVIIADQIPVRLVADVLKNTTLKIAHRIVARDDRGALAGAMAMDDDQSRTLSVLTPGEAAVFGEGDDDPLLVRVPRRAETAKMPTNDDVRRHMAAWWARRGLERLFQPTAFCVETCAGADAACAEARRLMHEPYVQRTFARIALSTAENPAALDRLWPDWIDVIRARRDTHTAEHSLLRSLAGHAAAWYADRRGAYAGWLYVDTAELSAALRRVLLAKISGPDDAATEPRGALHALHVRLHARTYPPYGACDRICDQAPPTCQYRHSVADLIASGRFQAHWLKADAGDSNPSTGRPLTRRLCRSAAYELVEFPGSAIPEADRRAVQAAYRRAGLCFLQQILVDDGRKLPATIRSVVDDVLTHYDDPPKPAR